MSLTSILRDKSRSNIKDWLKHYFPNPGINEKSEIKVIPKQINGAYLGEIGTAFDYLFRFKLERINKSTFHKRNNWIAYGGLEQIQINLLCKNLFKDEKFATIGYYKDRQVNRIEFFDYFGQNLPPIPEQSRPLISVKEGHLFQRTIEGLKLHFFSERFTF